MRRTRSNSVADLGPGSGRRSLRNSVHEEFCQIPTKFRIRMPRPEPKVSGKYSPMRRSTRLSGEVPEALEESPRTRKRRLHSLGSPGKNGQKVNEHAENGLKSPKGGNSRKIKRENGDSSKVPLENGICSRTRHKFDSPIHHDAKGSTNAQKNLTSTASSPTNVITNSSPKRARFSSRHSKSSPNDKPESHVPRSKRQNKTEHDSSNAERNENDSGSLSDCKCENENDDRSTHATENNIKCELCGKRQPLKTGKNGSILNGSFDSITSSPRNLRSSGQATSISSFSSLKYAGSPVAGEEAENGSNDEIASDVDVSLSSPKSRQNSSQELSLSHPENETETEAISVNDHEITENQHTQEEEEDAKKLTCTSSPYDKNVNMHNNSPSGPQCSNPILDAQQTESNHIQNDNACQNEDKPIVNGFSSDIIDELSRAELDLLADEDCISYDRKKRKMNLRSSGVRCDPDFYTLSLDLMIKRPRMRSNLFNFSNDAEAPSEENDDESVSTPTQPELSEATDKPIAEASIEKVEPTETKELERKSSEVTEKDSTTNTKTHSDTEHIAPMPCISSTPQRSQMQKIQPRKGRHPKGLTISKLGRSPNIRMVLKDPDEPPPLYNEEPPHGPAVYYFESDHVALKHNKDYHHLLHTVSLLESQRHRCLNDIQVLEVKKSEALVEPIAFVEKLQSKEKLTLPYQQDVTDLPRIEWSKYSSVYGTFGHVFSSEVMTSPKKPVTRKVQINFETGVPLQPADRSKDKQKSQGPRSQSFGIAWTVEEQRKLEELLIKYPSEENESNRYRRIAEELGTRTALQVQSRVQKYFIKLAKAGLRVPGTMPKLDRSKGGGRTRARPHPHHHLTKLSTFFPTFHCPVKMHDDEPSTPASNDDEDGWAMDQDQVSDEEDVPDEMRYSDEYLEILRLKRIRREQLRVFDNNGKQALAQHVGYECDMCNSDPIQGVRYHCIDCPAEEGVDLCQSCIRWQGQFETEKHKASHRMEPVYKAEHFVDDDYSKFVSRSGEYNYLDPNFLPSKT